MSLHSRLGNLGDYGKHLYTTRAAWWIKSIVHNCIIHPVLPLADAMERMGFKRFPQAMFWLHDNILPPGGG